MQNGTFIAGFLLHFIKTGYCVIAYCLTVLQVSYRSVPLSSCNLLTRLWI